MLIKDCDADVWKHLIGCWEIIFTPRDDGSFHVALDEKYMITARYKIRNILQTLRSSFFRVIT